MARKIVVFFDKLEDRIRISLSHRPILYAIIGAVGVILVWKGVEDTAASIGLDGPLAFIAGVVILLMSGLLVSFFIGDSIIISGFKKEKKLAEKTEAEVAAEQGEMQHVEAELARIEKELEDLRSGSK